MITIPDYIYERSVRGQLHLNGKKGSLFSKNGNEASIIRAEDVEKKSVEASFCLFFQGKEVVVEERDIFPLQRRILCAGGRLETVRAEVLILGGFEEEDLRRCVRSLGGVCEKVGVELRGVGVHRQEAREKSIVVTLLGEGKMLSLTEAPWQQKGLFTGEGIVITGSIGRGGSVRAFLEHKEELSVKFPPVFMRKMENRIRDRLPFLEMEMASFFGVTAMVGAEEGGLLAALYRLGDREEAGLKIYADRLFFDQETVEIAEYFDLDPMKMSSEGVYVMAVARAEDFVESLRAAGLPAVLAGEITREKKRVILFEEEERFIEEPKE